MRRCISLAAGVGVMLAGVACSSGAPLRSPSHEVARTGIPALGNPAACAAFTVRRQGRLVASGTVGVPATTTSRALFDIGSAAKSITAAAVVLLAQEHHVELRASIDRYLPDIPARDRSITLAQLLTHTSGLPENFTGDQTQLSRAAAVRAILRLRRNREGQFRYSNAGYTLLAAIVEAVSGRPYRDFVEQRLLGPAGMTTTGWYGTPPPAAALMQGHVRGRETGGAGTQAPSSWATLGAGGMTSTAADMDRWLTALTSHAILNPKSTQLMFAPRVGIGQPSADAAYGWITGTTPDGVIHLIGGQTDYGYTSDLRILPDASLTSVALSCSDSTPAAELGHEIEAKYA